MICPKCNHERTSKDDPLIPDYQCPKCGVIYAKFKTGADKAIDNIRHDRDERVKLREKSKIEIEQIAERQRNVDSVKAVVREQISMFNFYILIPAILLSIAGYISYISPAETVRGFVKTLAEGDASELENYVDFNKLKINLKATMKADIDKKLDSEKATNKFYALGLVIGNNMAETTLNNMITPSGMKAMFMSRKDGKNLRDFDDVTFDFSYDGYDWALVEVGDDIDFKLERHGIFSWKIINFINK